MSSQKHSLHQILIYSMIALAVIAIALFAFAILYNVIPYLIYLVNEYLLGKSKRKVAKQLNPKRPSSPWVRISDTVTKDRLIDECSTVSQLFSKVTQKYRHKHCFGCREVLSEEEEKQTEGKTFKKLVLGDYQWFTSEDIDKRVEIISKGFLFIGIKPKDIVMIFAETRLEWMLSCQSLLRIGATVATLYATLGEEGIGMSCVNRTSDKLIASVPTVHGIIETEVTHIITNFDLLVKLRPIMDQILKVKAIVYMNGYKEPNLNELFDEQQRQRVQFYSLKAVEELGNTQKQLKGIDPKPEDTAVLMYTSGSTGIPKGVMISHTNLLTATKAFYTLAHYLNQDDVYCAYLPLAHILEMSAELFFISNGLPVGFATIQTLTDNSTGIKKGAKGDATLLRPTIMAAVPLILDRIKIAVTEKIEKSNLFSKYLAKIGIKYKSFWFDRGFDTPVINYLICRKIRANLGSRLRLIPCGGAPLSVQTHKFLRSCFNIKIIQGYGLTETSASTTLMGTDDNSVGFVGPPLEGVLIRLIDWEDGKYRLTDKPNPRGELVVGGETVSNGYYKNQELTKESYKEEHGIKWFFTGDIGEIFPNGSLKIIDRKKDIIKLSTGEYIPLGKIEQELKKNPFVDNICVLGKEYLIALIVPNQKQLQSLAAKISKSNQSLQQLCTDSAVKQKVFESIQETGREAKLNKSEIPSKIKLCSEEWTPENGLVTAALKLRRRNVEEYYKKDVNQMFANS